MVIPYDRTLDLHFEHGGVTSHFSRRRARTFLRSTLPCVDAGNAFLVGLCPNGLNIDRLIRASNVIARNLVNRQCIFCFYVFVKLLPVSLLAGDCPLSSVFHQMHIGAYS